MHLRPLHDRIVVKRAPEKEKSKGGIIIPDNAKEKPSEGEVLAVGEGHVLTDGSLRALDVRVGEMILFGKYAGTETTVDGETLVILREDDVLAIRGQKDFGRHPMLREEKDAQRKK